MKICILMITHNRPLYTNKTLQRLCDTAPENAKVFVWDNGSHSDTINILRKFEGHSRIGKIIYHNCNEKLSIPTNWFWKNSDDSDLIGKVDDDCLVPSGWCETLQQAHTDIPNAGILSCWHFLPEDFNELVAMRKIQKIGNHRIMRNCWVGGTGYLMKRKVISDIGVIKLKESFTDYCLRAAASGYINGWYFPFLYQIHMDDPRNKETGINNEEDFQNRKPLSAINFNINSREEWIKRAIQSAQNLQAYSYNPRDFIGIRATIIKRFCQLFGRTYLPTA